MAITDNLQWFLSPKSGDTTVHNEVGSGEVLTGTATLVESGGVYGWRISNAVLTGACPSFSVNPNSDAVGITFAIDLEVVTYSASSYAVLAGAHPSGVGPQFGVSIGQSTTNNVRLRWNESNNCVFSSVSTVRKTYVYKLNTLASSPDFGEAWITQTSRSGDAPDSTSTGANAAAKTIAAITMGYADATIVVRGMAVWSRELTDAECATIADDGIVATLEGGGATTHDTTGALSATAATVAGSSSLTSATTTHEAFGALSAGSATLSGSATYVAIHAASGTLQAGTATVSGAASRSAAGTATLSTPPLKNNTGTVLASLSGWTVNVYNPSTGALIVQKTGLSTDASGVLTITDAALTASTTYSYEPVHATYGRRLPTATAA